MYIYDSVNPFEDSVKPDRSFFPLFVMLKDSYLNICYQVMNKVGEKKCSLSKDFLLKMNTYFQFSITDFKLSKDYGCPIIMFYISFQKLSGRIYHMNLACLFF